MTNFVYAGNGLYIGTSTDTKVAAPAGYIARETDTGDEFVSDGTFWWLRGMPSPFSQRRVGYFAWGSNINSTTGAELQLTAATGVGGSNGTTTVDTTNGKYFKMVTGATSGNKGGYRMNVTALTMRQWNPRIHLRFKLVDSTNMRMYVGLAVNAEPTGDDPLANASGFMFGISTSLGSPKNANWVIWHNVSTNAATNVDDTSTAFDTNINDVYLVADNTNTKFSWRINSGSYNDVTSNIPTATNSITLVFQSETAENLGKEFDIFQLTMQSDK